MDSVFLFIKRIFSILAITIWVALYPLTAPLFFIVAILDSNDIREFTKNIRYFLTPPTTLLKNIKKT